MKNLNLSSFVNAEIDSLALNFGDRVFRIIESDNRYQRSNMLGHITASGLVISNSKVLLIWHPHIGRWIQPGGHIDEGESPANAAIREVYEETGYLCALDSTHLDPIDIDIHEIPENPKNKEATHLHIDFLYKLKVVKIENSSENIQYDWFSFERVRCIRILRALSSLNLMA